MAPQAMVMNMKGKREPGMTGPSPPTNRVTAGNVLVLGYEVIEYWPGVVRQVQHWTASLTGTSQTTDIMSVLLAIIASISLVVGGVGIMNIMLVSVTERTREIGVLRAIGATDRVILKLVIIEGVTVGGELVNEML